MNYIVIFDVIIAVLGVYLIYAALHMKKTGEINTAMVSSEELKRCRNKAGFIVRMYKPTLLFGIVSLAFGILAVINCLVWKLGRSFDVCSMLLFLIVCICFSKALQDGKREFFLSMRVFRKAAGEGHLEKMTLLLE